ncbi:twin-arginine translocase TatA/TatE family subunit [Streptomyces sp. NPDC006971]|uniref:twin-arginine translocase TatA/TatE family subunit n=1 Tax=Streptomyces sp. NPDC006971 TaxID=3154784 RepID=UPI0033D6F417
MLGFSELAIILIVVICVLGAKRLPELARSAGKSARILKAEARAMKEERPAGSPADTGADAHGSRVIRGETVARTGPEGSKPDAAHAPDHT